MYKRIPGNETYLISIEGEVIDVNGKGCTLPVDGDRNKINLYGKEYSITLPWLALYAHFEIYLPAELKSEALDIEFTNIRISSWHKSGKIMVFKKPIVYKNDFRIIPGFTDYAINRNGEILETIRDRKIYPHKQGEKDYPEVHIWDPDAGKYRDVKLHRLVALAWVKNKDPGLYRVVNHRDGNKRNYQVRNLEWVTYKGNSDHAYDNNLRRDNKPCMLRDSKTGEIKKFRSFSQVREFLNYPGLTISNTRTKAGPKLFRDRFEFKLAADTKPWFYQTGNEILPAVKPFINAVQAYNLSTGEIIEEPYARWMAKTIGRTLGVVQRGLAAGENRASLGYAFRYKTDKPWNTNFIFYKGRPVCILASHQQTKESRTYSSLRQAAKDFHVDRDLIKMRLLNGVDYNGWLFKEIENAKE